MFGGDEGDRTPDLGIANAALSQLSYIPTILVLFLSKCIQGVKSKTGYNPIGIMENWNGGMMGKKEYYPLVHAEPQEQMQKKHNINCLQNFRDVYIIDKLVKNPKTVMPDLIPAKNGK